MYSLVIFRSYGTCFCELDMQNVAVMDNVPNARWRRGIFVGLESETGNHGQRQAAVVAAGIRYSESYVLD